MIGYRIPEREMCCMLSIGEAFVFYLSLSRLTPEVLPHLVCSISRHLHTQFPHLSLVFYLPLSVYLYYNKEKYICFSWRGVSLCI